MVENYRGRLMSTKVGIVLKVDLLAYAVDWEEQRFAMIRSHQEVIK